MRNCQFKVYPLTIQKEEEKEKFKVVDISLLSITSLRWYPVLLSNSISVGILGRSTCLNRLYSTPLQVSYFYETQLQGKKKGKISLLRVDNTDNKWNVHARNDSIITVLRTYVTCVIT